METRLNLKIVDPYNIQLGNHFHDLIKRYHFIAQALNIDKEEKNDKSLPNWGYIEAVQLKYYGLVEALWNSNLIKPNMKVVDVGCGYGTTLFNVAMQFNHYHKHSGSKLFNNTYTGIEKDPDYIDRFQYLKSLWKDNDMMLTIKNADIIEEQYGDYDLILSYCPYRDVKMANALYKKIFGEMKSGSILIEHFNDGKGHNEILINSYKELSNNTLQVATLLFGGKKSAVYIKL